MQMQQMQQQQMQQQQQQQQMQQPPQHMQHMQQQHMQQPGGGGDVAEEDTQPPPPPTKPEGAQFLKITSAENGVVTVAMNRAPVNSFSLEFFAELNEWLMWLSYDEACTAIIMTSAINMVYSAGIDIMELHNAKDERFAKFWTQFQEMWLILNSYPKPIIAAVNGNSPAGGCIMAMCCDYRIMARAPAGKPDKPYRIGLNETKLGIIAPPWVMNQLTYVIGSRKAEKMLQLGETPTADEALTLGLVDKVVEEEVVMEEAMKMANEMLKVSNEARWMSKDMMRRDLMQFFAGDDERRYDTEFFTQLLKNPEVQGNISKYLSRLQKK